MPIKYRESPSALLQCRSSSHASPHASRPATRRSVLPSLMLPISQRHAVPSTLHDILNLTAFSKLLNTATLLSPCSYMCNPMFVDSPSRGCLTSNPPAKKTWAFWDILLEYAGR